MRIDLKMNQQRKAVPDPGAKHPKQKHRHSDKRDSKRNGVNEAPDGSLNKGDREGRRSSDKNTDSDHKRKVPDVEKSDSKEACVKFQKRNVGDLVADARARYLARKQGRNIEIAADPDEQS